MKPHSLIFDDFFKDPNEAKRLCSDMPIMDYPASDGVVYPGIIDLPKKVRKEIDENFKTIYGPMYDPQLVFGRYSMEDMDPPNWAHSDGNMAQFLGLIYLFGAPLGNKYGTYMLRHIVKGFELHPRDEEQKQLLLSQSNEREAWEETFYCPAKFNRLFILSADYIHAAGKSFGLDQLGSRLVISVFFNLKGAT